MKISATAMIDVRERDGMITSSNFVKNIYFKKIQLLSYLVAHISINRSL